MDSFINKIIDYLGIEPNSKKDFRLQDVKNSFWDCIKDQLIREYKGIEKAMPFFTYYRSKGSLNISLLPSQL